MITYTPYQPVTAERPGKARLSVTGTGTVALTYWDDWTTGDTIYHVSGPRVSGAFTVTLEFDRRPRNFHPDSQLVSVRLGRNLPGRRHASDADRLHLPVVNSVTLWGSTRVDLDELRERRYDHHDVWLWRTASRGRDRAPIATSDRAAAVISGIVRHWHTRVEGHALRLAAVAAALATDDIRAHYLHTIRVQERQIADSTAIRDECAAKLAALDAALATFGPINHKGDSA